MHGAAGENPAGTRFGQGTDAHAGFSRAGVFGPQTPRILLPLLPVREFAPRRQSAPAAKVTGVGLGASTGRAQGRPCGIDA